jgi:hypothetical protein
VKNLTRCLLFCALGWAFQAPAGANTVIYPVEGIDDLWQLKAEDFRQKYGGINVTGLGVGDEGWYVRYRHENLTYFFGPLADRAEAQKKMWELESVRDAAIRNDPKLSSSQVDFVRFNYSGVYGRGGNTPFTGKGKSDDGKSGPEGDADGDGIANKDDPDMDGDGIPNAQDGDADGDGIPNGGDKYPYGSSEGMGTGQEGADAGGKDGKNGRGNGPDGQLAGGDGADGAGGQKGQKGSQPGQSGAGEKGDNGDPNSPIGAGQNGMQQVASAQGGTPGQRGSSSGQQGSQSGQQGSQAGQQAGQQGSQSGQQGSQGGQPGQPGGQPGTPGQQGGGGNPLDLVALLLKKILGL